MHGCAVRLTAPEPSTVDAVRPETRLVRGHVVGVDRATTWPYDAGEPGPFYYSRYAHPTGVEAERLLGELDGGQALLFPSGAAATTALVLGLLSPGSTIAIAHDAYYGTTVLFRALERWGVRFVEFDQTSAPPPNGADLVWLEAPSNPLLSFPALAETVEATHTRGGRVVVDATAATPVLLRPLEHGADVVLHSATKYLSGHSDVLLGVVTVANDSDDADRLREFRGRTGIVAAPDPAWLLLRGLRTLAVRVERASRTAHELARRLAAHPGVERVRYPGLGDERAARYLAGGFGGLLSFDVAGGAEAARRMETSTRVIANATSLGGVGSVLETRARWEGGRVPENLIRLSVGLEDVEDLWADLERALAAAR
jgi:cystathionine gamma-synthase